MKNKVLLIGAVLVLIATAFYFGASVYKANEAKEFQSKGWEKEKFVPEYAPRLGPSSPEVYLVEFLDPECESCREFYPFVKMIMQENPEKVQLVVRYAPFHPNSKFAIKILEAARKQGKYWETLDVVFRSQPYWGSHHHPQPELLWKYLPEAGLDIEKLKKDMEDPEIEKMIEKEMAAVQELGVRGTPSFFVNGKRLETFGVEPLRALIESELQKN